MKVLSDDDSAANHQATVPHVGGTLLCHVGDAAISSDRAKPGLHLRCYTVEHRTSATMHERVVALCDACVDLQRCRGNVRGAWEGEVMNGTCAGCGGRPSEAHFRFATPDDLTAIPRGEIVYLCGNGIPSRYYHADVLRTRAAAPEPISLDVLELDTAMQAGLAWIAAHVPEEFTHLVGLTVRHRAFATIEVLETYQDNPTFESTGLIPVIDQLTTVIATHLQDIESSAACMHTASSI